MPYITPSDLAEHLSGELARTESPINSELEGAAELVIAAVSSWFEKQCGRRFTQETGVRTFEPTDPELFETPKFADIVSVTSIATDADGDGTFETVWDLDTDIELAPLNASDADEPYTTIRAVGVNQFPVPRTGRRARLQIGAAWGWPAVPPEVPQGILLQSAVIWRRKQSPDGIVQLGDLGGSYISRYADRDVKEMIAAVRRRPLQIAAVRVPQIGASRWPRI